MYALAKRGTHISSRSRRRSRPLLCFDLFEQPCLDTGCYFLFTGSDFVERDHLRRLILHLLTHVGKHLEELITIEWRLGFDSLHPEWRILSGDAVLA